MNVLNDLFDLLELHVVGPPLLASKVSAVIFHCLARSSVKYKEESLKSRCRVLITANQAEFFGLAKLSELLLQSIADLLQVTSILLKVQRPHNKLLGKSRYVTGEPSVQGEIFDIKLVAEGNHQLALRHNDAF